jgi:hypothetical protein
MFSSCLDFKIKKQEKEKLTYRSDKDEIFKSWIKDTLPNLKNKKINAFFDLQNDSLLLIIKTKYEFFSQDEYISENGKKILNLINKYNDVENYIKLSFIYEESFYPSYIKGLKYEFSNSYFNIVLYSQDAIESYFLNRGSISYKNVYSKDSIFIKRVDYIWDNGKIVVKEF